MKKPLVIFGSSDLAQLAHYYFSTDSDFEVVAFTVDANYIKDSHFCGLPVIPFEGLVNYYPPGNNFFFVALGYSKLNAVRKEKFLLAKQMGYAFATYISSRATVLNGGQVGKNCLILEGSIIQPFVRIGDNIVLWSSIHIGHHSVINNHSFIAPHASISGGVEIGEQCFIGINSTLRNHIKVGDRCVIGAGTLLLSDADADGVYIGVPAARSNFPSASLRI